MGEANHGPTGNICRHRLCEGRFGSSIMGSKPRFYNWRALGTSRVEQALMDSKDQLIGLKIQITIDEDGTRNPVSLPPGTIVRKIAGTDSEEYYVVHLDHSVKTVRAKTGEQWDLWELALVPHFAGATMWSLVSPPDTGFDFVHVRLFRPQAPLGSADSVLDLSRGAYFALGTVRRV